MGQIGTVRNSDSIFFYGNGEFIYENRWNNEAFENHVVSDEAKWPESLTIGQGRNDGVNRIYAKTSLGRIEVSFVDGKWVYEIIHESNQRGAIVTGVTQSDGLERVYSNFTKAWKVPNSGPLCEYTWNGESYDEEVIVDGISGATGMIEIGDGRNDGTNRIYVPHFETGGIYEITHIDSFRVIPDGVTRFQLQRIRIEKYRVSDYLEFEINIENGEQCVVSICDISGRILSKHVVGTGRNRIDVSAKVPGIYLLKADGFEVGKFLIENK